MRQRFAGVADFYAVYIKEAHPTDGWVMQSNERAGIRVATAKTFTERVEAACQCCEALSMGVPLLIDGIDDAVGKSYSGFPDRLYLVGADGKVIYKGGRGPFGFLPGELEQTLVMSVIDGELKKTDASKEPGETKDAKAETETATKDVSETTNNKK